jgi:putative peptidoglycan lipid II flippase
MTKCREFRWPHPDGRSLGLLLSSLTGLQIVAALGLQGYLIAKLGAGAATDAFYAGGTLAQVIAAIAIDTLAVVLVPLFSTCTAEQQRTHGWLMCAVAMAGFTALALVLAPAAQIVTSLLVPGFSEEARALTADLTRVHLLGLGGTACTVVISAIHQVRGHFVRPPVAALVSSLAAWIVVVWTIDVGGIVAAAWAQVLAFTLPALLLLPGLGRPPRHGWEPRILLDVGRRLGPLVAARGYFLISAPLDRWLVSFLPAGSLVLFEIVSRVFGAIQRVFTQGVLIPVLPHLSRVAHAQDWHAFTALYRRMASAMGVIGVMAVVGLEVGALVGMSWLGDSGRQVLGRISAGDLREIAWLAMLMSGILPGQIVISALSGAYYAQGNTRSPSRIAAVAFTFGTGLKVLGFWLFGIQGLAFAVTVWSVAHCAALALSLRREVAQLVRQQELVVAA